MAIEIRNRRNQLKDIRFNDWIKQVDLTEPKALTLLAFFIPGRYSSFTLSFTDGTHRIRKSFPQNNEEVVKELRKWYKKLKETRGRAIFTVERTEEGVKIDLSDIVEEDTYTYREDINGSLILKRISEQREDIPF